MTDDDDKQSAISRLSGSPRTERVLDALQLVAGNRVRHARCAPEFLDDLATRGPGQRSKKLSTKKFKIISGVEARHFYKTFMSDTVVPETEPHARTHHVSTHRTKDTHIPSPIVFAVTVWDEAGRKCIDYYMTWRNKSMQQQWKDFETRIAQLDSEFRELARSLDKEFKRMSSINDDIPSSSRSSEKSKRPSPPPSKSRAPPPDITVSKPDQISDEINPGLPDPPASAADSVMSLPLLNMIRGVPFSHRIPLRVTNPDRFSMISEAESPVITETPKEIVPETREITGGGGAPDGAGPRTSLAVPVMNQSSRHNSSEEDAKRSSASILSSDTKSSRSSRSSRSSVENVPHPSSTKTHATSSDTRRTSDHHRSRRDKPQEEPLFEFTIVVLGDKLERDTSSWHGLTGQASMRDAPAERHSPWTGPVSRPASTQYSRTAVDSDSDETDDESQSHGDFFGYQHHHHGSHLPPAPPPSQAWGSTPVIPMKPLMEAMGYIPSNSSYYYQGTPVLPPGSQYAASAMSSPAPNGSPYLYSTPRMDSSPYLPGWVPLHHVTASPMPSRPPSRAYSSHSGHSGHSIHSYGSPYVSPHHTPPF